MRTNHATQYKGFWITIEVRNETIYAFWCNDKEEQSKRFSGYSLEEIEDLIRDDIDSRLESTI